MLSLSLSSVIFGMVEVDTNSRGRLTLKEEVVTNTTEGDSKVKIS